MNLIGKSQDETRQNVLDYAAKGGMRVIEDRLIDSNPTMHTTMTRYMTISNGSKTVKMTILADGRMTREVA